LINDRLIFIAYSENLTASLYLVNVDGNKLTKLADIDPIWENTWPPLSLSPDRKRIAYFANSYLSIYDIGNGDITKLNKVQSKYKTRYLAWSLDGSKIAYVDSSDLYIINSDGTNNKLLAEHNTGEYGYGGGGSPIIMEDQIRHPVWLSDGKHIIFDDFCIPGSMSSRGILSPINRTIYSVNIEYSSNNSLPFKSIVCEKSEINSYSSFINKVLICLYESEKKEVMFYIMNEDGTNLKLFSDTCIDSKWSPDGTAIAYVTDNQKMRMANTISLRAIPLTAGIDVGIYITWSPDDENAGYMYHAGNFIWSPDSKHIAYIHQKDYFSKDIFVLRRDLSCKFLVFSSSEADQCLALIDWIK